MNHLKLLLVLSSLLLADAMLCRRRNRDARGVVAQDDQPSQHWCRCLVRTGLQNLAGVAQGVRELTGTAAIQVGERNEALLASDPAYHAPLDIEMGSTATSIAAPEKPLASIDENAPLYPVDLFGEYSNEGTPMNREEEEDLSSSDWFKLKLARRDCPSPSFAKEQNIFGIGNPDEKEAALKVLWNAVKGMPLPGMPEMKVVRYLGAGAYGTVLLVDIREMQRLKPEWFQKLTALMGAGEEGVGSNEQVLMVIKLMNYGFGELDDDGSNTIKTSAQEEILGLQALKKVQSEIPVKGFGEIEFFDGIGILMEYIPGVSMFDGINNGLLSTVHKVALIPSMFRGLAAMHEAGVYWGDLKHENLMLQDLHPSEVGPNGLKHRLRFIDMGLSTVFNEGKDCKGGKCPAKGTPGFVPWNLMHEPRLVATRANFGYIDVFAAAVVAVMILQGPPDYAVVLGRNAPIPADMNVIQNGGLHTWYKGKVNGGNRHHSFLKPFYQQLIEPLARNWIISAKEVCQMPFLKDFERAGKDARFAHRLVNCLVSLRG